MLGIQEFFDSGAGQAALAVLAVGLVAFLLTVLAQVRNKTFTTSGLGDWLREDLAGQILPIWLLLFVGYFAQGITFANIPLILAAGLGAAGVYVAATLATVLKAWSATSAKEPPPTEE